LMLDLGLPRCALLCRMHVSFVTFVFQSKVWILLYDETIQSPLHQPLAPSYNRTPKCVRFVVPLYSLTTREPLIGYSAISRRSFTAVARVQSQKVRVKFVLCQNRTGQVILPVLGLPLSLCTILIHLSPTPDNLSD
jgi:hypothetical protein